MRSFTTLAEIEAAVGEEVGVSDWLVIDQERIDAFAAATGDFQWIHVDPERAAAGPFGATIAHGYLTLSLVPLLGSQILTFDNPEPKLNYGVNKVRFTRPVPVGSRLRARVSIAEASAVRAGTQVLLDYTLEIDAQPDPITVCVAQTVVLLLS